MELKEEPKQLFGGTSFNLFHPWVDKVAQVVPKGAQSGSKGKQTQFATREEQTVHWGRSGDENKPT